MIRDQETLNILLSSLSRFVQERLMPNESIVAESDKIPAGSGLSSRGFCDCCVMDGNRRRGVDHRFLERLCVRLDHRLRRGRMFRLENNLERADRDNVSRDQHVGVDL